MDIITSLFAKVLSLLMALLSVVPFSMPGKATEANHTQDNTNYPYILVIKLLFNKSAYTFEQ